jgi:SAM-dependent methyltransferase
MADPARKALGAYYTPPAIAAWLGSELVAATSTSERVLRALDPASGDGELLEAVRSAARPGGVRMVAVDIDEVAVEQARRRLGGSATVIHGDGLTARLADLDGSKPDVVIANPPWGASLPRSASDYRDAGFTLARGQFDSYDLFVEAAIRTVVPGGVIGLVLPDSLLLPEHEATRRLLLAETQLLRLVRLGEGIFDGVFRGALLLVARRGTAEPDALVHCARLHFSRRNELIRGALSLSAALEFHGVAQSRFAANPHAEFDLDVRADEEPFFQMSRRAGFAWEDLVTWGRGIEIGKDGRVCHCPHCGISKALPRVGPYRCGVCSRELGPDSIGAIIRPLSSSERSLGWEPLIVGSDVERYSVRPSREIQLAVPGIRYKSDADLGQRKLLVRKTGVGIQAAIDETGAQTVQAVFHFVPTVSAPKHTIDYLLGVLNSRPMQAFHLRQSGDHEWRSHPYVTPRVLRALPIPDIEEGRDTMVIAKRIATLAGEMCRRPTEAVDLQLDAAVLELYGLGASGSDWSRQVLAGAQQLRAIARLATGRRLTVAADAT